MVTEAQAPGALVDGRYELDSLLGEGTFGSVWRALDRRLAGRAVAVKFLKPEFLEHPEAAARFATEADALAQVAHPHVVQVTDRGSWQGHRYLVTELVEGQALTAWLDGHRERGALPALAEVYELFDQVCAGVEATHAVRRPGPIVHRDIKPDNVMVQRLPGGEPLAKIVDFGIAQLGRCGGTRTGSLLGTPQYMAPEQAMGQVAEIGPWTDVFALAVVLVEMLSLRQEVYVEEPFWGTSMQRPGTLRALLGALREEVPPALWDLVAQALRARARERPADAGALRLAFQACVGREAPRRSSQDAPATRPVRADAAPDASTGPAGATVSDEGPSSVSPIGHTLPLEGNASGTSTISPVSSRIGGPPRGRRVLTVVVAAGLTAGLVLGGFRMRRESARRATAPAIRPEPARDGAVPGYDHAAVAATSLPGAQGVTTNPELRDFLERWSQAVLVQQGAVPLDGFYAPATQFRRSGGLVGPEAIRRYVEAHARAGDRLRLVLEASEWQPEATTSPDGTRACVAMAGAGAASVKVRAWAIDEVVDRTRSSSGEVPCDRLEGRYLLRLRRVGGALRICHETWSLCDGVCVSCPAAPSCRRCGATR